MDRKDIVIGIDGGGTNTRAVVSSLSGHILAGIKKGAASIHKDAQAKEHVHSAILDALNAAGAEFRHVRAIAAGIAGYDSNSDLGWIEPLTDVDGLSCPRWHVNDAVSAHYGALASNPGIAVISGTGSNILGITEDGRHVRNWDYRHYAASAARFIAYDAVFETLAGETDDTDSDLIRGMLEHWEMHSLSQFRKLAGNGFSEDRRERDRKFSQFAPAVTEAALLGSSVARRVCDRAIHQIKVGIELLADSFSEDHVDVAFIGSVVNSPYFHKEISSRLAAGNRKRYTIVKPRLSPACGSVLIALTELKIAMNDDIIRNLQMGDPFQ